MDSFLFLPISLVYAGWFPTSYALEKILTCLGSCVCTCSVFCPLRQATCQRRPTDSVVCLLVKVICFDQLKGKLLARDDPLIAWFVCWHW